MGLRATGRQTIEVESFQADLVDLEVFDRLPCILRLKAAKNVLGQKFLHVKRRAENQAKTAYPLEHIKGDLGMAGLISDRKCMAALAPNDGPSLSAENLTLLEKFGKLGNNDRDAVLSFAHRLWLRANYRNDADAVW